MDKAVRQSIVLTVLILVAGFSVFCQAETKAIGVEPIRAADHVGSDRYALVVGIDDYRDKNIPDLKTCQADAAAVYALLTDPAKGGIAKGNAYLLLGEEATTRNIKKHLAKLRQIPSKSTVFVYFSGHGAKESGQAYWVTQDSEIDYLSASGLSDLEIQQFLSQIPSDRVVVMLDCCYAAATVKGGKSAVSDFDSVLKQFTGKGRAYLMAAGSGEEAIEAQDLKSSVFTHYLVEGMNGKADKNTDGVIVLTELTGYIDEKVADEARVRGGIQRPVVKMEEVSEPSKFGLTIDAVRIRQNLLETEQEKQLRQQRLDKLKGYYLDEKLPLDLYQLAKRLVESPAALLDSIDQQRLREVLAVADGALAPDKLQRALDVIETPTQRAVRLEKEAKELAERQKHQKIVELLQTAKAKDNKEQGKEALAALAELLTIDPSNTEAQVLYKKISGYFGPNPGDVMTNSIGMKLVYIPAGSFMMGSNDGESREKPVRQVTLTKGFWMGQYEVTQEEYQKVMGSNPSNFKGGRNPVEQVSWEDAVKFCEKLTQQDGKRYSLPTEAQWEYACRSGTSTSYSFSDSDSKLGEYAWYDKNSGNKTQPVGQKKPNAWGMYDMHGNVLEWCLDWYEDGYYGRQIPVDPLNDGYGDKSFRVLRGGSWGYYPYICRAAYRCRGAPGNRYSDRGFRVVCQDFQ